MRRLLAVIFVSGLIVVGVVQPTAAKAPKKCKDLVTTVKELDEVMTEYFEQLDIFFNSPEGSQEETDSSAQADQLEIELRSIQRLVKRDLKRCAK